MAINPSPFGSGGGTQSPVVFALADAATIAVNAALGNYATVTLGGSRTMGAPSNASLAQQPLIFRIQQPSSAGPDTITWASSAGGYEFGADGAPTLSTANNAVDEVGFRFDTTIGKWLCQGWKLGFS